VVSWKTLSHDIHGVRDARRGYFVPSRSALLASCGGDPTKLFNHCIDLLPAAPANWGQEVITVVAEQLVKVLAISATCWSVGAAAFACNNASRWRSATECPEESAESADSSSPFTPPSLGNMEVAPYF
jgi:hypothetical protein